MKHALKLCFNCEEIPIWNQIVLTHCELFDIDGKVCTFKISIVFRAPEFVPFLLMRYLGIKIPTPFFNIEHEEHKNIEISIMKSHIWFLNITLFFQRIYSSLTRVSRQRKLPHSRTQYNWGSRVVTPHISLWPPNWILEGSHDEPQIFIHFLFRENKDNLQNERRDDLSKINLEIQGESYIISVYFEPCIMRSFTNQVILYLGEMYSYLRKNISLFWMADTNLFDISNWKIQKL